MRDQPWVTARRRETTVPERRLNSKSDESCVKWKKQEPTRTSRCAPDHTCFEVHRSGTMYLRFGKFLKHGQHSHVDGLRLPGSTKNNTGTLKPRRAQCNVSCCFQRDGTTCKVPSATVVVALWRRWRRGCD